MKYIIYLLYPVIVRSVKQRIITKSSTEAELVALSDESGTLLDIKQFLIAQGYEVSLIISQDNQSTQDDHQR